MTSAVNTSSVNGTKDQQNIVNVEIQSPDTVMYPNSKFL